MKKIEEQQRYFNGQKVYYKPLKAYEPMAVIVRKDNGSDRVLIEIGKKKQIVYTGNLTNNQTYFYRT